MSYESTDERIERLENQVARLIRIVQLLAGNIRQNQKSSLEVYALLADKTTMLVAADLFTLKTVFENSRGFDEPFRQAMLKTLAEQEKQNAATPSITEELKKLSGSVLPEDLFGPGPHGPLTPPAS